MDTGGEGMKSLINLLTIAKATSIGGIALGLITRNFLTFILSFTSFILIEIAQNDVNVALSETEDKNDTQ